MTRKHFEAVAKGLATILLNTGISLDVPKSEAAARCMARNLEHLNPKFDHDTFVDRVIELTGNK